jgi:putative flippase GtrA
VSTADALFRAEAEVSTVTPRSATRTASAQVDHKGRIAPPAIVAPMSVDTAPKPEIAAPRTGPVLDVVVPVYNEEADLEPSVRRLHQHLSTQFPYPFRITIADNASVDATPAIAARLAAQLPEVTSLRMPEKGRGRALRAAWTASDAQVLAYCDVDLSTDLAALLPLVAPLISGHSDLAIGTRLSRDSRVVRGAKREFISRTYNLILRGTLAAKFSDAQCGFKAIRGDIAQRLVPLVEDTGWFFDTELLVLAERAGLRIHEVPVDWVDDPNSSVDIVKTATDDLKGIVRLGRALAGGRIPLHDLRAQLGRGALEGPEREVAGVPSGMFGQLVRFAAIGVASTLAYLLLYVLFRAGLGPFGANLVALVVTAVANTAANRRLTFGVRGRAGAATSQIQGLIVFGLGLVLTTGALALLPATAGRLVELAVLVGANALATVLRFVAFRSWMFRSRVTSTTSTPTSSELS